ncbi:MAG: DNRLRE domain-containing protein, partial [Deltaproteobacteria bacterium]
MEGRRHQSQRPDRSARRLAVRPRFHTAAGIPGPGAPGAKLFRGRDRRARKRSWLVHAGDQQPQIDARLLCLARERNGPGSAAAPRGRTIPAVRGQPGEPGHRAVRRGGQRCVSRPLPRRLHLPAVAALRGPHGEPGERSLRRRGRLRLPGPLPGRLHVRASPLRGQPGRPGRREQCDGTADSACPGRCRVDCTCAPVPSCGDNLVNQPGEQCDGSSSAACPGRCRRDCTCAPLPRCGDNVVNQVSEQCDGTDGGACPGLCRPDCTCAPPVAVVEADTSVSAATTTTNYGKSTVLEVDASPLNRAFLRVRVNGVGDRHVAAARLRLVVGKGSSASSDSGGRLHAITSCGWNELSMTWKTQPAIDGPLLGQAGPVLLSQAVDYDLTSAIGGDGVHCFALDTPSLNNVEYNSKEAAVGKPQVLLTVLPPVVPFCGDGRANQPSEQCDGTADSACPGRCRVDCTCASPPVCGDNR